MTTKIVKTEEEWLAELGPVQYKILREAGTERPWSGALLDEKREGTLWRRALQERRQVRIGQRMAQLL
jgi:peptide methionine sulfoxide reductase MsrB